MFNRKQKEIDELNSRCVELARQLRYSNFENKQLRELRLETERNNTKILKVNTEQAKLLYEINQIATSNRYGNPESNLGKIKELSDDHKFDR